MQRVLYGIPTFTQFDRTEQAVLSLFKGSLVPDQIAILDNSGTGAAYDALKHLTEQYKMVHILPRSENIVAGAWNDIMGLMPDGYTIIANDDVIPHTGSIKALIDAANQRPDVAMWNGSGHSGNSYSFFLLQRWAYEQVGRFDERFKPAYYEDNDYDYRLRILAGLLREEVPLATFDHVGSATLKAMTQIQRNAVHLANRKNLAYYISKWGGKPTLERYTEPFAGIDLSDM